MTKALTLGEPGRQRQPKGGCEKTCKSAGFFCIGALFNKIDANLHLCKPKDASNSEISKNSCILASFCFCP
ncbi:hypothetical protein [Paenibacillus sanfengchensis]|uniref:hypothetical protein n=1 Tax=Paenibacillus sanfengchensis TaxID=3119819 RepID=UPI002FE0BDBB